MVKYFTIFEEAMLEEINEDRIKHGKKPLKDIQKTEIMFDEGFDSMLNNLVYHRIWIILKTNDMLHLPYIPKVF